MNSFDFVNPHQIALKFQDYDSYYERRSFDEPRDLYERRFSGMGSMSGNSSYPVSGTIKKSLFLSTRP